jgi:DNA replication and repair protein RecF
MISHLIIRNFRNLENISIRFSPKVNILVGDNGQGKTNILEAIHILMNGQSFRFTNNENLIKKNHLESFLKADCRQGQLDYQINLKLMKSRKMHQVNEKKISVGELVQKFPQIIFSPESLSAIKSGSDERRNLIDELITSLDGKNADLILDFRKSLKTRNKILKDYQNGVFSKSDTQQLLLSLNSIFIRLAVDLTWERLKSIRMIIPGLNQAMRYISNNEDVDISVEYVISGENSLNFSRQNIEKSILKRMQDLYDAELSTGVSLVGPQKHDISFLYNGNNSRFYCSQGQQRALILAFKMAQIVYHRELHGSYPTLLLDDVLSELDLDKRDSLIRFLGEINTQIFITTTDFNLPGSMKSEDCAVFKIREGQIG